ncbi:DUF4381 domain-containing protein [Legionella oakridgensis]|uniref:DUF4381 domain-containing protein n=2 Tax=Legionella oakridgensis TaxID=29423 RepID=W0BCU7_9GAMM|nr:DUF4381 domain-containing protein [Legionella oakridgensis]AHE68328.1 hypothetical protein Loa_02798 [Legionella oakridgensis ATCC 33761 = DSM 21215]ETO92190.1 hypothetical protein LOR_43c06280 [Legionella oakridgensis RV-2-2007]KTD39000.1 hypothetical protein Loak_1121 [Legionella oakridgensis]STY21272.1 Uncharacterised protein [Legionella longbeachae]
MLNWFKKKSYQGIIFGMPSLLLSGSCSAAGGASQSKDLSGHPGSQALSQLRDIHMPLPIGWWPLAPGWYVLIILLIIVLMVAVLFLRRSYLHGQARRRALRLLAAYQQQYQREGNCQHISACISELLKRVALVYFPRKNVASLQGEAWILFLNETGKNVDFSQVRSQLLDVPYQRRGMAKDNDLTLLFSMTKKWINQRRKPCLN